MSHRYYNPARTRLQRSELAVPGSSPKMFEKALNSNADYVFLDLEDAVSPNDKPSARENIIRAIVSAYGESAFEKVELLKEYGVTISKNPSVMGETVKSVLNGKKN